MQPDGLIFYDQDKMEIGRNLFTDQLYEPFEELRVLGSEISQKESGWENTVSFHANEHYCNEESQVEFGWASWNTMASDTYEEQMIYNRPVIC